MSLGLELGQVPERILVRRQLAGLSVVLVRSVMEVVASILLFLQVLELVAVTRVYRPTA